MDQGITRRQRGLLLLLLRLDDLLHNLGLFHQECTENALLDAVAAPRTTICSPYRLLALGNRGVLAGTKGRDTRKANAAVTALGRGCDLFEVVVDEFSTGGLYDAPPTGGGVVWLAFAEGYTLGHGVVERK